MAAKHEDRLADFTADVRIVILSSIAVVIGVMSAFVAYALVWLINFVTNIAYFQKLSGTSVSPASNTLGVLAVIIPVIGGLIVGLMARFG